jgi:hypothetical protein
MNIERIQNESFGQTLPRRRRALEYEIEDLKAEFISNLEQVSSTTSPAVMKVTVYSGQSTTIY